MNMRKKLLLVIVILSITIAEVQAQTYLDCGLFTNFLLNNTSTNVKPSKSEIKLLEIINEKLKLNTYLNKFIRESNQTIIISLYTTGTLNDLKQKLNDSNVPFNYKKNIKKKEAEYSCYSFNLNNEKIIRIVFNEPNMTLCIVIDVLVKNENVEYDSLTNDIIKRISFKS
jgi:hypothetical protein